MAQQATLAIAAGFEKHAKRTRRAEFLAQMEVVVPWRELVAEIEPFYPKAGNGRPPVELERMLRIYFLQQWFNLSNPGGTYSERKTPATARTMTNPPSPLHQMT